MDSVSPWASRALDSAIGGLGGLLYPHTRHAGSHKTRARTGGRAGSNPCLVSYIVGSLPRPHPKVGDPKRVPSPRHPTGNWRVTGKSIVRGRLRSGPGVDKLSAARQTRGSNQRRFQIKRPVIGLRFLCWAIGAIGYVKHPSFPVAIPTHWGRPSRGQAHPSAEVKTT